MQKKANREKRGDKEMILFTPRGDSKEGFNKHLIEQAGGAENLSHKTIYDGSYGLYCSLARVTDKNEALRVMIGTLNDELKELRLQLKELKEENEELTQRREQ